MHFKGDIIITDPCYIIKEKTGRPTIANYPILKGKGSKPFKDYTTEEMDAYKELEKARAQWKKDNPDDWEFCDYGSNMEALGIFHYIVESTDYGDWSCTTFETGTKNVLGKFCADAGLVGVFLLEEVLAYNPDFDYHIKRPWTTTLIKDFDGEVCTAHSTRHKCKQVLGVGNINFSTIQTGL